MTRHFVVAYKRSAGKLLELGEFDTAKEAHARRMELDLQYRTDHDVEVAVLGSDSLDQLKRTHSRYFKTFAEIAKG